ncbi:prolyl oligopeptidase family serine peptidase [Arthrobacter sp. zg-Y820]|uniref:prolyl oligopeptidase family serine peptidase n=1 Tax=unclassified Arthrobacter TaxID=235627 RepID=UPI001E602BCB|nr:MULTISPECIES: prolyl oligopeptidase family serine peptidase [unclassified Arthrobacter]MCC9198367.1 prolyl oligopeptidase family serine peptidase [Arthrobacter sp. zg-Y820]MDK1281237.1 prolyl oligopeptidase family serine peptidase [Arthrobacter sp. zg.Y820]MDK1361455.1 prolyl oligopeptidase family serine peptidase [Arthrobacter sp. zg-Y1219]WIB09824.1 prolyl oligopeptidase family serine peptidase [Arthrobacter sp. zg-Y820]
MTSSTSDLPAGPYADDEFLWLEDIYGHKQLDWVRAENKVTEDLLAETGFEQTEKRLLEVLDSTDRIPMAAKRGGQYYNFWRDAEHPKGLWRRTTWESYLSDDPQWEILLDLDELSRTEGIEWVWGGSAFLRPADGVSYRRALVVLSPDGGDAARYREFDVVERAFVPGGFDIPAAKNRISWAGPDELYVGTDFGPGSMTTSSYPRTSRILRRGMLLADAAPYFEVPEDHMMAVVARDQTPGFERDIAVDIVDFYNSSTFLRSNDSWVRLDVPLDMNVDIHRQWLVLRPRTDWELNGTVHAAGSLLAADLDAFLAGSRELATLFTPDPATSLQSWSWTRDQLLLNLLRDVSSEISVLDPAGGWTSTVLDACPPLHTVDAYAVDDEDEESGNDYWLISTGFLTPSTLSRGTLGSSSGGGAAVVKESPSFFDASSCTVEQHFAVSADGTRVPYFQVGPKDLVLDGGNPTLLNGYGGFEQALTPTYSGVVGRGWLERSFTDDGGAQRSGVYVLANIRGGGEYGPDWHRAALQENRHRAYEDFAAVAQDLTDRGVTSRQHLGCTGRSNGGLLVGNMLTTYPHLFGAVSCGVPLLDMRRYTKLSAGYSWIAEYGDPDDPQQWEFVRTFSPYHLLKADADYPPTLIWTATSDDRVGPVQARKMAARMKALGVENVWFHEALEGGHAGASDNRQAARMYAMSYEFLWEALTGRLK